VKGLPKVGKLRSGLFAWSVAEDASEKALTPDCIIDLKSGDGGLSCLSDDILFGTLSLDEEFECRRCSLIVCVCKKERKVVGVERKGRKGRRYPRL